MSRSTFEILPRQSLAATFTQSSRQALDVGDYKTGSLQIWVEASGTPSADAVVQLQESNLLDDDAFASVGSGISVPSGGFQGAGTLQSVTLTGRYIRLQITPPLSGATSTPFTIQAIVHLNRA